MRFMEDGWSVKKLIRDDRAEPGLPAVGREADADAAQGRPGESAALAGQPPAGRGRGDPRHDPGRLRQARPHARAGQSVAHLGERAIDNDSKGGVHHRRQLRRSVYLPVIRNDLPQIFEVFDFADPEVATGRRDATTVATQALYLMNSPFVLEQARHTAERLLALPADDAARLTDLYRRALGRSPNEAETGTALQFLADFKQSKNTPAGKAKENPEVEAWSAICLAVFGCTEFRFVE